MTHTMYIHFYHRVWWSIPNLISYEENYHRYSSLINISICYYIDVGVYYYQIVRGLGILHVCGYQYKMQQGMDISITCS